MALDTTRRQFIGGIVGAGAVAGPATAAAKARTQSDTPVVWTLDIGGSVREYVIVDTTVYVGTDQNRLLEVSLETGEIAGILELSAGVYSAGLEVTDAHIAVATEDDQLAVYRRSDIGTDGATPVYRTQLTGAPMGMDVRDEQLLVGTRETLLVLALSDQSIVWQRNATEFDFNDWEAFGPPIAWTESGVLAIGGQGAAFLSAETGELDVYLTHDGADNAFTATNSPPVSTTQAGSYVAFTGADAHGCCPSFGTMVIDTRTREWEFRDFSPVGVPQLAGAVTEEIVVYQRGETTTLFQNLETDETFQTNYAPRPNGIAATPERTFVADASADDVPTRMVAVSNDGFGIEWSFEFDRPIGRLQTAGEYLFAVDQEDGQLLALAQSGDGAELRPTTQTASPTAAAGASGTGGTGGGESTASDTTPRSQRSPPNGRSERGFLTNGDGSALAGVGVSGISTIVTVVSIFIGLAQLTRGGN